LQQAGANPSPAAPSLCNESLNSELRDFAGILRQQENPLELLHPIQVNEAKDSLVNTKLKKALLGPFTQEMQRESTDTEGE
jgi:hypothetical protein